MLECGGLPPLLRLKRRRCVNIWAKTLPAAKAGASSRTPKDTGFQQRKSLIPETKDGAGERS